MPQIIPNIPRLHIFNPDTEYALAIDREYYTPPARVVEIRSKNALIPSTWANKSDAILILDKIEIEDIKKLRYYHLSCEKEISIFTIEDIKQGKAANHSFLVTPWGWNRDIRKRIIDISKFTDITGIPSEQEIASLRLLSHRRTTIKMMMALGDVVDSEISLPREIFTVEDGMDLFCENRNLYFKAPWSSSGRGVMLTDDRSSIHVQPWLKGIISSQGSVMVEKAYSRKLDFATEWLIHDSENIEFLGFSIFNVSRRGKYISNVTAIQSELYRIIAENYPRWSDKILIAQKKAIADVIAPEYKGPLGIDMFITESGSLNPCVELNLRRTMGMINSDISIYF